MIYLKPFFALFLAGLIFQGCKKQPANINYAQHLDGTRHWHGKSSGVKIVRVWNGYSTQQYDEPIDQPYTIDRINDTSVKMSTKLYILDSVDSKTRSWVFKAALSNTLDKLTYYCDSDSMRYEFYEYGANNDWHRIIMRTP